MSNCHKQYELIIPAIHFIGEFEVKSQNSKCCYSEGNNVVISLTGGVIIDRLINSITGEIFIPGRISPATLLPTQTFHFNDNIFNDDPNFTNSGLAFTTISGKGVVTYYTLYTDTTKTNYVSFGPDVTNLTNTTVKASFIIRKKSQNNKCSILTLTADERVENEALGIITYKIEVPVLLSAILFVKDGFVIYIKGTVGNKPITLLHPEVYQSNDNKFDGGQNNYSAGFTTNGLSFATTEGLTVNYYNLYKGTTTDNNLLYTGFDITSNEHLDRVDVVNVVVDSSGYYCEDL